MRNQSNVSQISPVQNVSITKRHWTCAARSLFNVLVSNSQVASTCKTILDTKQATISLKKNQPFHGKRKTKTTSAGTHTQRLKRNVWRSRRCALRTFQNSFTRSSPYITIKHRKMFYIIFVNKVQSFQLYHQKFFWETKTGSRDDKSVWILFSPRLAWTQYLTNRKQCPLFLRIAWIK